MPITEVPFPKIPGIAFPAVAHVAYRADYGPRWAEGMVDVQPPRLGPAFPTLVPTVDPLGNEPPGVPTIEVLAPLATYTPWSLRDGAPGQTTELANFTGMMIPLPRTEAEREAAGDPRPSIERLYGTKERYLKQVDTAAADLVRQRFLLAEDVELVRSRAAAMWDWVSSR